MDIGKYSKGFQKKDLKSRSEKQSVIDEIIKLVGVSKRYGYGYWGSLAKGISYGEIVSILKEIGNLPEKYNKSAVLTNKLHAQKKIHQK